MKGCKNMKKLFKRIAIMILVVCFSTCFSGILNAAAISQSNRFTIFLSSEEDVDLSDISIKVYKKINISPLSEGLFSYEVEYIRSATSDSNGKISFEKPDGPFTIEFDLDTLPSGMGLKQRFLSYNDSTTQSEIINLQPVVAVEAYFAGENLNFTFKDSANENLFAHHEIDSYNIKNNSSSKSSVSTLAEKYSESIDCTLTYSGTVNVNGALFPYHIDKSYSELDYLQYISLLYDNNCITREEQISCLCNFLESEYGTDYRNEETKNILQLLKMESRDLNTQQNIDRLISLISERSYVSDPSTLSYVSRVFYCTQGTNCCEGGVHNIRIYYSAPCTLSTANTVADKAINVLNYFINQLGFACPKSISSTSEINGINDSFCIVLTTTGLGGVSWGFCDDGTQAAYIYLNYSASGKFDTVLAHELQHCIQNRYNLTAGSDLWWKESCANWASMLYAKDVLGDFSTRWGAEYSAGILDYLNTTRLSLTFHQGYRVYSALFPMLLEQMLEDEITILSIYEEVNSIRAAAATTTNQQIFTAIENVAENLSQYDLRYILEFFGQKNYHPTSYYSYLDHSLTPQPNVTKHTLSNGDMLSQDIGHVGYGYYIINPQINSSSSKTVTAFIETDEYYSAFTCVIREGFLDVHYAREHKIRLTSNILFLDYTLEYSASEYLILIMENTSTQYDSSVYIDVG